MTPSARDIYLASLDPASGLTARRLAERSGIPDNDPLWLLLHDIHRALDDLTSSANGALANEPFAARLSAAVGVAMTDDQRIVDALTTAIQRLTSGLAPQTPGLVRSSTPVATQPVVDER